jgi:hypothetical protein
MAYNRTLQHFTSSQELATQWASGQSYILDQLVLDNDRLYRCILAHTSGASFAGDSIYWSGINPGQTIPIADGGTGQTTQTAAFDALAPTTTAGDIIVHNGTDNVRQGIGSDGQVLVADNTQPNKLKWATLQQGAKNYITYGTFENGATTGWSLFNTTLTSKIPTGSITAGAASITSFAVDSTTPIAGTYDLRVASSGALTAGQGFISDAFTIDREDQAKPLAFSFAYEAVSGTMNFSGTSNNTFAVYIYDVSGSAWIQPAGVYNLVQSSGVGIASGTFQTTATGTQYRIAVVCITATAGAVEMRFDTFQLGPQGTVYGSPITDWQDYTPTVTGMGTGSSVSSAKYRRVGDTIEVEARIQASVAGSGASGITLSLPANIDTSKLSNALTAYITFGVANFFNGSTNSYSDQWTVVYDSSSTSQVRVVKGGTGTLLTGADMNLNSRVAYNFKFPVAGLSSSVQMSNDTDTRVVAFSAYDGAGVTATNTTVLLPIGTTDVDTHATRSSNTYVVPVSGFYRLSGKSTTKFSAANTSFNHALLVYKNGNPQNGGDYGNADGVNNSGVEFFYLSVNSIYRLNAGDIIDFRYSTNYTGTATTYLKYCSFERLSGPATIAASETVAARYRNTSGQSGLTSGSAITITGWSRSFDTHEFFNSTTGVATIPVSGKYLVQGQYLFTSAATNISSEVEYQIQLGGSISGTLVIGPCFAQAAGTYPISGQGSNIIQCSAGDTLTVQIFQNTGVSRQLLNNGNFNWISFTRVGN